jgi:hypothetical protein
MMPQALRASLSGKAKFRMVNATLSTRKILPTNVATGGAFCRRRKPVIFGNPLIYLDYRLWHGPCIMVNAVAGGLGEQRAAR